MFRVTVVEKLRQDDQIEMELLWRDVEAEMGLKRGDTVSAPTTLVNADNTMALMKMVYRIPEERLPIETRQKIREMTEGTSLTVIIVDEAEYEELEEYEDYAEATD